MTNAGETEPDESEANEASAGKTRKTGATKPDTPARQNGGSLGKFAKYFRGYMGVGALVTAALPIGAAAIKTIPMFDALRGVSATFTSLLCFLILAWVVYSRHTLGSVMFKHRHARMKEAQLLSWLPGFLVLLCVGFIFSYLAAFQKSVVTAKQSTIPYAALSSGAAHVTAAASASDSGRLFDARQKLEGLDDTRPHLTVDEAGQVTFSTQFITKNWTVDVIPLGNVQLLLYLLIFMTAESAFVLMAMREYLQEQFHLSDEDIVLKVAVPPAKSSSE